MSVLNGNLSTIATVTNKILFSRFQLQIGLLLCVFLSFSVIDVLQGVHHAKNKTWKTRWKEKNDKNKAKYVIKKKHRTQGNDNCVSLNKQVLFYL